MKFGAELTDEQAARLFKAYKFGMDRVIATGVTEPPGPYVLLRAITESEISKKARVVETVGGDDARNAEFYSIQKMGTEAEKARPRWSEGYHCMHISAAGDPVKANGRCLHMLVHYEDLCLVWDPLKVLEVLPDGDG